jgi:hypothetical protein
MGIGIVIAIGFLNADGHHDADTDSEPTELTSLAWITKLNNPLIGKS